MSTLLQAHFLHYDPLFLGMGRRGLANAMHATLGQLFPRPGGGYNLYRGLASAEQIDWHDPVGAAGQNHTTIRNFPDRGHDPDLVYYYAVRAVSPGGVEQDSRDEIARLAFGANGQTILPSVESPSDLRIEPLQGGRFRLSWYYRSSKPAAGPKEFRIHTNNGTGAVDYDTPVTTVPFLFWRWHYEYVTDAFASGTTTTWSVRTVNSLEQEERNTNAVSATADAVGPPPNADACAL